MEEPNEVPKKQQKRARFYCFTLNNWTNEEQETLGQLVPRDVRYIVWGREVGDQEQTPHLQGVVALYAQKSIKWLKTRGFARAHLEEVSGPLQKAIDYCKKDKDYEEYGDFVTQGERTDLISFKRKIDEGESPVDIAMDEQHFVPYIKFHAGLEKYAHHVQGKRIRSDRTMPKVYIRYGASGTGKTKWLDDTFGLDGWARMPNPTGNWFITPTVSAADTVLIDDVGPSKIPKIEELLEWTDRYPIEFNSKGGHLWWKPKNIVLTSNYSYKQWWPKISDEHLIAFERRLYRVEIVYKDRVEVEYQREDGSS